MKNRGQQLFIIISVVVIVIFGLGLGLIHFLNKPLFPFLSDISDRVSSTFESKHSDKDIMDYIKEEHGIDVEVLENTGAKNLKTSDGGYAVVQAKDGTQFTVNINAFGAISGDTYTYEMGKTVMRQFIKANDDTPYVLGDVFTDLSLKTNDETSSFSLRLTIDDDVDLLDDVFMEQLFAAYEIVKRWNEQLEKSDDLSFKQLQASYFGKEREIEEVFHINIKERFESLEQFEKTFASTNEEEIFHSYNEDLFEYVEAFAEKLPEDVDLKGINSKSFLECYALEAVNHCSQLGLHISVNGDEELRFYDNEKTREKLLEAVHVIKSMDLPIERVIVHRVTLPFDLNDQDLDREQLKEEYVGGLKLQTGSFALEDFQQIKETNDIRFIED